MASTFWAVRSLMWDTCSEASAPWSVPTSLKVEPSDLTASSPPPSATSKYGVLTCLGRKPTVMPFLVGALGDASAFLPLVAASPSAGLSPSPHAAVRRLREDTAATRTEARREGVLCMCFFR